MLLNSKATRKAMIDADIRTSDLAKYLNYDRSGTSKYIYGKAPVSLKRATKIANYLNVEVESIIQK